MHQSSVMAPRDVGFESRDTYNYAADIEENGFGRLHRGRHGELEGLDIVSSAIALSWWIVACHGGCCYRQAGRSKDLGNGN